MPDTPVLYSLSSEGVATLTLNNPQRRNALSSPTLEALERLLEQISQDSRCVS